MTVQIAIKTKNAIDKALELDQGNSFRKLLGKVLPHIGDAYRSDEDGFRSHLGASLIGRECARDLFYTWRWAKNPKFSGQMLRLFNRGHLEEGRFIALLLMIGAKVYQQDENGKQFRVSGVNGNFGGSGDGFVVGIPDLDPNTPALLEFKTHNDKSFKSLIQQGVKKSKPEHYVQMCVYMEKMGLAVALYGAVNKNTDELHWELVPSKPQVANEFELRAENIIYATSAPAKLSSSPGFWKCKFCDYNAICHFGASVETNCRTCESGIPSSNGTFICARTGEVRSKELQLLACDDYVTDPGLYG